uniref:RNA helicase n=1 Tax=Anopheles farauti TaxID=69004 RepID=A0A182QK13_9DIPT
MENQIVITYFVHPHKFWYKPSRAGIKKKELRQLQVAVDEYCEEHYQQDRKNEPYEPILGEVVTFYDPIQERWLRCNVAGLSDDGKGLRKYRLWSIDEGMPREASIEQLKPLPDYLQDKTTTNVKRGALKNILPVVCVYDPLQEQLCKRECPSWNVSANMMLKSFIDGAQQMRFENVLSCTVGGAAIDFGDLLFVTTTSKTFNAANILSEASHGLIVESRYFIAQISESDAFGSSQGSTVGDQPDSTNSSKVELDQPASVRCEVSESDFDESASMIGPAKRQQQRVAIAASVKSPSRTISSTPTTSPDVKKSLTLAQKLQQKIDKAAMSGAKTDRSPSNLSSQGSLIARTPTEGGTSPRVTKQEAPSSVSSAMSASSKSNILEQIRHDKHSLTYDVGLPEPIEHELMEAAKTAAQPEPPKPLDPSKPVDLPKPTEKPTEKPAEKLAEKPAAKPGAGAMKNMLMQRIARAKAASAEKSVVPATKGDEKLPPTPPLAAPEIPNSASSASPVARFFPAGVTLNMPKNTGPTVQSNAELKRFETLIQEEKCIFSRRHHYRVLVHGMKVPTPIEKIASANFSPAVHEELKQQGFTTLQRLQAYAWPHIMRGNSFICVNTGGTGKTFAFLPAVCSTVKRQIEEPLVKPVAGPVAIIVCHTSREVQRLSYFCRKMLRPEVNPHLAVLECYGIRDVTKTCIMPHFASELQLLCKNCDSRELQMIVTSSYWMPTMGKFFQRYQNMLICIGAFLEAAVYAKAEFHLRLARGDERKQMELIRYIKAHDYRTERTIVFCNDNDDLGPIVEALKNNSINHFVCNERMVLQQHAGFSNWDQLLPGDMVVFVCCDAVLGDLLVSKAQHIVHYSLPATWSTFTRRFASSFGYYECPYLPAGEGSEGKGRPSSMVLLNENNNEQLPKLIDFLELHKRSVPDELIKLAQNIRTFQEHARVVEGRAVSLLCTNVLGFAVCRNARTCVYRHNFTLDDIAPHTVPRSGALKMKICHVFSPAHFAVRLEAHRSPGGTSWTVLNDTKQYLLQDIVMQAHFANVDRHQMHGEPRRNELCAVFHEQNYWRCRIINYDDTSTMNCEVQLLLIDIGRLVHVKSASLLHLPEKFTSLPDQAMNVRIAGVVPHDYEQDWDKTSTVTVRRWIENYETRPNCHIQGNVLLALKDTVWVDELCLVEQLEGVRTSVTVEKVRASIISKQFGVGDRESFEQLRKLVLDCEKLGMESLRREVIEMERERSSENDDGASRLDELDEVELHGVKEPSVPDVFPAVAAAISPVGQERTTTVGRLQRILQKKTLKTDVDVQEESPNSSATLKDSSMEADPEADTGTVASPTNINDEPEKRNEIPPNLMPIEADNTLSSASSFELISGGQEKAVTPKTAASQAYQFDSFVIGDSYNVIIGHYLKPDDFYVYRCDRIREVDAIVKEFTKDESKLVPLEDPRVGQHCLVRQDNFYHRGRIISVVPSSSATEAASVEVFFLDFGGIYECNELFAASDDVLRGVPFLAIKGSFAHIQPPGGENEWSTRVSDDIYDKWLEKHNLGTMFASVTRVLPWVDDQDRIDGCHKYEMLLCDSNSKDLYSIVSDIVYDGLAIWMRRDEDGNAVMSGFNSIVDGDDENDDDDGNSFTQVNFTHEELMAMLNKIEKPRNGNSSNVRAIEPARIEEVPVKSDEPSATLTEVTPKTAAANKKSSDDTTDDEKEVKKSLERRRKQQVILPRLQSDYRFPQTVWQQDSFFVVLRVHAPDVTRYDLRVTVQSLLLQFVKEDDGQRCLLPLNLFGPIEPRHTVHEIRGLWIVVRLLKLVPSLRWPTLQTHSSKVPWLKALTGTGGDDSGTEGGLLKENVWDGLTPAHLDSPVDTTSSGNEEDLDSDLEDEDGVFLALK